MVYFHAIILGIVEGITEFLPISSTGHLVLTSSFLRIPQTEFVKSFEIAIQLGAILSVVVLYARMFFTNAEVMKRLVAAFIPTGIIGFVLYKLVKQYLLGNENVVVWALLAGGVLLIIFELIHKEKEKQDGEAEVKNITYAQSILLGIFQSIAIIPGVSRSAATIIGGLLMGIPRRVIVEFSFLLAVPTMLAATVMDLSKTSAAFTVNELTVLGIGFVVSFIVALFSIKWLLKFIKTHSFIPFGIYRIVLAILFLVLIL